MSVDVVPLRQATRTWFSISLQTFGGPAGQIAVMHRYLVDDKRWIGEQRFLHALSYCMLLPGPEAQQLATYVGWLLNGWRGGLVAGVLFVLPGAAVMMALAAIYVGYGETDAVTGLFAGLAPAVVAIVIQAVLRVGRRSLRSGPLVAIAVAAFVALLLRVPFPVVVLVAGIVGSLLHLPAPRPAATGGRRRSSPMTLCTESCRRGHGSCGSWSLDWCSGWRRSQPPACSSGATACSSPKGCSSEAPPSCRSAGHTPCSRSWRSRRCTPTTGCPPRRWCAAWLSPSRPPGR